MGNLFDSLSRFIGIPPNEEIPDDYESVHDSDPQDFPGTVSHFAEGSLPRLASIQVLKPRLSEAGFRSYSIRHYADLVKEQNALILDVSDVASSQIELARRLIDFLAGVTLALGGTSREINPNMFLFAPPNFIIGGDVHALDEDYDEEYVRA